MVRSSSFLVESQGWKSLGGGRRERIWASPLSKPGEGHSANGWPRTNLAGRAPVMSLVSEQGSGQKG